MATNGYGLNGEVTGVPVSVYIDDINTGMATTQGGENPYQLDVIDLSEFTQYNYD